MRILVVEDDKKTAAFLLKGLKEVGFAVDHAATGTDGLLEASANDYDILIVDLMLPELDGISLIKKVRQLKPELSILILSAKHSIQDKVKGLETGADDYLIKPFAFAELLARIQALLRRHTMSKQTTNLTFHDLSMNILTRDVERGKEKLDLQQKEYALLEYMMRNPNRVITRTMILEHVWDMNFDPSTNVVDVLVCRLRDKIDRDFKEKLIHTVRGVGYVLKKED